MNCVACRCANMGMLAGQLASHPGPINGRGSIRSRSVRLGQMQDYRAKKRTSKVEWAWRLLRARELVRVGGPCGVSPQQRCAIPVCARARVTVLIVNARAHRLHAREHVVRVRACTLTNTQARPLLLCALSHTSTQARPLSLHTHKHTQDRL